MRIRLKGVDCPERSGSTFEAGEAARIATHTWIIENTRDGNPLLLRTFKSGTGKDVKTFDRYVGEIYANGRRLTEDLVEAGHAVRAEY